MTKERTRKRAHVAVQGELPIEVRIPRWELEILIAALAHVEVGTPVEDRRASP